ncbi:MAG: hypothetical protein ACP5N7_03910 [Candidatus Pacearchaeota archaeon]
MFYKDYTHNVPYANRNDVIDAIFYFLDIIMRIVDVQDCISGDEYRKVKFFIEEIRKEFKRDK